jgi:hypothetical protein
VFETGGRWARTVNEQFAGSFASNFLMPRSGVNRRFSELKDARQEKIRVADLFQLAQFYRVSIQASYSAWKTSSGFRGVLGISSNNEDSGRNKRERL